VGGGFFSAEIVEAWVVGSSWRWGADLTSGPRGSRMQARSGLHQCVGAGPRHGARRAKGAAGPRDGAGPRGARSSSWECAWAARAR
jgi:hypothetical protein